MNELHPAELVFLRYLQSFSGRLMPAGSPTVTRFVDWNFTTVRRVEQFVHVIHSHPYFCYVHCSTQPDDLIGQSADGWCNSTGMSDEFSIQVTSQTDDSFHSLFPWIRSAHFLCHLWWNVIIRQSHRYSLLLRKSGLVVWGTITDSLFTW